MLDALWHSSLLLHEKQGSWRYCYTAGELVSEVERQERQEVLPLPREDSTTKLRGKTGHPSSQCYSGFEQEEQ